MKEKNIAILWALFLGGFGAHRFYLGQTTLGILYLLFSWTFIPLIISLIDIIFFLTQDNLKFNAKYNPLFPSSSSNVEKNNINFNFEPQLSIPEICPHCKNPNLKRIRLCEWCGNQII